LVKQLGLGQPHPIRTAVCAKWARLGFNAGHIGLLNSACNRPWDHARMEVEVVPILRVADADVAVR